MPKLRPLSGKDVLRILRRFGFEIYSQKGSHIKLQRLTPDGEEQRLLITLHGHKTIKDGTLFSIYKSACAFIPEDELRLLFYTE